MDWRNIRTPDDLRAWQTYYDALSPRERIPINKEMRECLAETAFERHVQRELLRRQADKPSTRRKRRPKRH